MTTTPPPLIIRKMKSYVDAVDFEAEGAITNMIQMKQRLETIEEAIQREKTEKEWEKEWEKECAKKMPHYVSYIDDEEWNREGIVTSLIQMKQRLETEEETQKREKYEKNYEENCDRLRRMNSALKDLPEGWTAHIDKSTCLHHVYYYNTLTKETTWIKPAR